ncbi:MAG: class I SAM-dependent methyltransferase [Ignavibacteriaceae bacterium]
MLELSVPPNIDGVYYLSSIIQKSFDEETYLTVRRKELRIYSDSIVKKLPSIEPEHFLKNEWSVRKKSFEKLVRYISSKKVQSILEIGCGNGWLSNGISERCGCFVAGLDLNKEELKQAARVFVNNKKVKFIFGNIFDDIFPPAVFDFIIFAASIQYFNDLDKVLSSVLRFLMPDGEIHVIDSHFYDTNEIENARMRTRNYYDRLGFPNMSENYIHHSWRELDKFNYLIRNAMFYKPSKILNRFGKLRFTKFPWIVINKK